jgi:PTS system galactitol-specific IIA component
MASTRILDLLAPTAVCVHLDAADWRAVITALGQRLHDAGCVRDTFVQAALDREAQLPTGLPLDGQYNAAIPHTDIEHVITPALALATLARPVEFRNMIDPDEAVPVQLVILMAMEEAKSQVEMLQEIAGVLQDPDLIAKLVAAGDEAGVRRALEGVAAV